MNQVMKVAADEGAPFEDGPDRGRVIVSGAQTGGAYSLMEYVVAAGAGAGFGAHLHRQIEETFFVRRGRLEFLLGNEVTDLCEGDFVRVPAGVRHGFRNVSGREVELLVGFHPAGLEELFLTYRTDQPGGPQGEGFMAEAQRRFGSEFEEG